MKYKYFSILFLAVLIGLGHTTFSDEEINPSEDSATWWSQSIPEITIINEFGDTEEELQDLSISESHFTSMQETLTAAQQDGELTKNDQELLIQKIQTTQREIRKNIQKNQEEVKDLEKSIALMKSEMQILKNRQSDTALFLRKTFTE